MANYRHRLCVIAAATLPLALMACGTGENSVVGDSSGTVELFSWWTSAGEADALNASLAIHKQKYPEVTVVNLTGQDADAARLQLVQKMQQGNPPDTFQANFGADLMNWVKVNGIDASESPLQPIDSYVSKSNFYLSVVDQVSAGGALYAVPMDVHRINSLFFNKKVFADLGISEPTEGMTLDEFNNLCASIKAAGTAAGIVPLALGNVRYWTLQELVFEIILPAIAGADYYEGFWRGEKDPSDSQIAQTIDEALLLRCGPNRASPCDGYFNMNADAIDWQPALDMVQMGTAAMSAIGDWAKGYFESKGWKSDSDFGVVQFPSANQVFVYTVDTFPLPIDAPNHDLAAELLQTFASVESQVAFNHFKGSIPARSDIDLTQYPDSFDPMHLRTYQSFQNSTRALALAALLPSGELTGLGTTLQQSMAQGTAALIQTYLDKNYATLSR